jgi:adenosylmethionine-8-amino-7-oxononanoate aminotransferase
MTTVVRSPSQLIAAAGASATYRAGRLLEAGLIARADDRGEPVIQIAPPLICDRAQLDEVVDALAAVLSDAAAQMGLSGSAAG